MKLLFYLSILTLFASAKINAQELTPDQMTGWNAEGIIGKVKSVTYTPKKQVFFNAQGDPVKIVKENYTKTITYTTQKLKEEEGNKMQIVFGENTRTVQDYQASIGEGGYKEVYTFDRFGRVISLHITDMASNTVYEYVYKTDTDRFPSEMKWTITEEAYHSEGTYQYQYLLFDKYGNWAKRNVRKIDKPKGNKGYNPRTKKTAYVETASYVYS